MNAAQRKADWSRTAAFLKSRSFDVKFDLENTDYKRVENIGAGAYGVVCSAIHKKTRDRIAIKKIPNVFDIHVTAMRTYREIKILKHFHHDNVISIVEILKPKEPMDSFKDIYVVLDLMESDLHRIVHSSQDLTDEHIRYFLYQLLRGLKYVHSANVIHRDLKPSNLLVNEDCQLKIGDFGMARGMSSTGEDKNIFMTQYVATRWYRAPEIMLSMSNYTSAVDIWSVGCILAEMLGRKHLFPGTDVLNQLKLIIGVLGSPSDDFLKLMQLDVIKKLIKDWGHKEPLPLVTLFPGANRKALDLLSKMLTLYPKDRITAEEALNHPYLSKYHDPEDEPICIPAFNFDFEKRHDLKGIKLRQAIISEIYGHRHSPVSTPAFNAVLKPVAVSSDEVDEGQTTGHEGQTTGLQAFLNQLNQKQSVQQRSTVDNRVPDQKPPSDTATKIDTIDLTSEDKVLKIPTNSETKSSLLRVESDQTIQTSALPSSRDIEMLSAQTTVKKEVAMTTIPPPSVNPSAHSSDSNSHSKENVCEKQENKTISADTKATLKAALLNARKQRAENANTEKIEQNKKVTALSRQKERMMKRKEKADRAKRKEKLKERTGSQLGIELSDADKELLLRWKVMQPKNPSTATTTTQDVCERALRDLPAGLTNKNQGDKTHQQQQQLGIHAQVPTFIQPRPSQGQSCAFQGQVLYRVDNGAKKQPETRKSFPLEAVAMNTGNFSRPAIDSNNQQNNANVGLKSGFEVSHVDLQSGNMDAMRDRRMTSPMLKRNSTGSAVLSQESTSKSVPWRESSDNRLFGSHRGSDPLLPGYNSPPQDSSQSESESTPSQGLSPLALFDENSFDVAVPSQKSDYLFQNSQVPIPFQVGKNSETCDVPMFVAQQPENNLDTQVTNPPPTTTLPNLQQTVPSHSSERLKINPCPQEVTDQEMLSANVSRTSLSLQTPLQNNSTSTADWVSMLSRQFSKYQVEDIYPPALIGTPKGTGGGYGVGLPVDQEMQEGSANMDSAPLSATLLADWMEVSGNMSPRELEAFIREAELTSPMALSYSDFNLTS